MKFFTFNFNRKKKEKSMSSTAKPIKVKPGAVYIQDCVTNELSKLYTLDLATGKATFVGEIVTEVYDIAFVGSQLYGLDRDGDKTRLVKIDINSGDVTVVSDIGNACAGLAYNRPRNTLYATTAKQLIAINLETGKGTPVATVADKDYNCAEVAFDADGKAYITLIGYNKKKLLASCNLETSKVQIIGNIGFPNIASMEFVGDVLYGVTGNFFNLGKNGQLIRIDTTTGKGTLVTMTEPKGRWAGISIYEPATVVTTEITPEVKSDEKSETTKEETSQPIPAAVKPEKTSQGTPAIVSQESKTLREEGMSILTIDTKNNCYVINPDQMNNLQQNVATSFTFEKGTFDIKISGGRYKYAKAKTEGEPFVLLWIYGVNGSKFINKTTGYEIGATWTTLNGSNDNLQLEVKQRTVLNALFFDVNNNDNSGSIDLLISSNKPFFAPQTLTVDSKRNSYVLDENQLASLKQSGTNSIELNPGNYRLKISEGNATYWSDNKKFDLEPWALIWIQGGKFITKLTGIEVEETWTSLNGFKDEVVLEVKEKTTLTGLFFDTYKEDNEGQIILAIESVSETEQTQEKQQETTTTPTVTDQEQTTTTPTVTNVQGSGESTSREAVGANSSETVTNVQGTGGSTQGTGGSTGREAVGASSSTQFTFRFNEDELKQKWEEQLQQINASMKVIDENDVKLEGQYWEQLEQWLFKNYEKQFKNLAIEVAKVRFTMDAYTQQMEFSLNQQLQGWSSYLDKLVENRLNVEISNKINQQINQYVDQTFEQKIRSNIGLIINNLVNKQELNQYIDRQVDGQIDSSFEQKIRNNINLITQNIVNNNTELEQYVSQQIDNTYEQKVQNNLHLITQNIVNNNEELNRYIDQRLQQNVNNNSEVNNSIVNLVSNSAEINNKIEYLRNEWNRTFLNLATQHVDELSNIIGGTDTFNRVITQKLVNNNTELEQYVSQQIDNTYEQKVQNNLHLITQNIVNNNEELNRYIDQRLQQNVTNNSEVNNSIVNLVSNSAEINNKIENLRNEWNRTFLNLATQHVDELSNIIGGTDTFNRVITQKLVNNNTELNKYVSQQIDSTYEQKVRNYISVITQNIVNNNEGLNQYIDQRLQQNVINNSEVNNSIVNLVANSTEINNKINNVYRDIDIKIENVRNEWTQTFISLVTQHVDELINIIGDRDTFNIRVANLINIKVDELLNQILRTKNELTAIISNADRHLYEWTLGELMAIKGCLTDREVLVETLVTFSAQLRTKLDGTACVDINTFKPFKPMIEPKQ